MQTLVIENLDILVVEETKIDDTFSDKSIKVPSYKHEPLRQDRTQRGVELLPLFEKTFQTESQANS